MKENVKTNYKKNDMVTLTMTDLGSSGEGIGKVDGFTLFVKDALIGDVIEAKIEYAKSLLLSNKRYSLPLVAEMLGYNDQFHFSRQFRKETGMTPGQFRKENQ